MSQNLNWEMARFMFLSQGRSHNILSNTTNKSKIENTNAPNESFVQRCGNKPTIKEL